MISKHIFISHIDIAMKTQFRISDPKGSHIYIYIYIYICLRYTLQKIPEHIVSNEVYLSPNNYWDLCIYLLEFKYFLIWIKLSPTYYLSYRNYDLISPD